MPSRASLKRTRRRFSIDSQDSDEEVSVISFPEAQVPNSPVSPKPAHLSDTHDDPLQLVQDSYVGDRPTSYHDWPLRHDSKRSWVHGRSAASPWHDQEMLWAMAATRRREQEKRNRRINKLTFGCAAAVVVVVTVVVIVVFLVLGHQGMLSS